MEDDFNIAKHLVQQSQYPDWLVPNKKADPLNTADQIDLNNALYLVPPHAWYAEQIAWRGAEPWWVAAREAWIIKELRDNPNLSKEGLVRFFSLIQRDYPFIGMDFQPIQVRLGTMLWVKPHSSNPEDAPDPSLIFEENLHVDRWRYLVNPYEGELIGVLRQWVPGCKTAGENAPPELWEVLETGVLQAQWHQLVLKLRAAKKKNTIFPDLGYIAGELAAEGFPHNLQVAAYAYLRLLGHEPNTIPQDLKAMFGGLAETAIIRRATNNHYWGVGLPQAYNAGHDSHWYAKLGSVLSHQSKWIEDNYGSLLFSREHPSKHYDKTASILRYKRGRPLDEKYKGLTLTNEHDFVNAGLERMRAGMDGWAKFRTEAAAKKALSLAFRRLKTKARNPSP